LSPVNPRINSTSDRCTTSSNYNVSLT
jgi:hypothetical protein